MESNISSVVTSALSDFGPQLLIVGTAGIGLAMITWGLPKALGFFKKTAK